MAPEEMAMLKILFCELGGVQLLVLEDGAWHIFETTQTEGQRSGNFPLFEEGSNFSRENSDI